MFNWNGCRCGSEGSPNNASQSFGPYGTVPTQSLGTRPATGIHITFFQVGKQTTAQTNTSLPQVAVVILCSTNYSEGKKNVPFRWNNCLTLQSVGWLTIRPIPIPSAWPEKTNLIYQSHRPKSPSFILIIFTSKPSIKIKPGPSGRPSRSHVCKDSPKSTTHVPDVPSSHGSCRTL